MASAIELTAAARVPTGERTRQACQRPSTWGPQSLGAQGRRPRAGAEAAGVTPAEEEGKASWTSRSSFTESRREEGSLTGSVKGTTLDF